MRPLGDFFLRDPSPVNPGARVVRIGRSDYQFEFWPAGPPKGDGGPRFLRWQIVNRETNKVRVDLGSIHSYWLRMFVFELGAVVADMEKEWETLPQEFIEDMARRQQ